ncbi:hypothetical protein BMI90_16460 [Thioclava sp. L04-15]|nr:hypothetical protein BMI90_16460 [Thioclava sp. L04-15]
MTRSTKLFFRKMMTGSGAGAGCDAGVSEAADFGAVLRFGLGPFVRLCGLEVLGVLLLAISVPVFGAFVIT